MTIEQAEILPQDATKADFEYSYEYKREKQSSETSENITQTTVDLKTALIFFSLH